MSYTCPKLGCTVAATGICLLNVAPAGDCPVMNGAISPDVDQLPLSAVVVPSATAEDEDDGEQPASDEGENDSSEPATYPGQLTNLAAPILAKQSLSPGRELGLDGLSKLARKRPIRLIGLLGAPDAGKTMALVSMFVLAAQGKLKGYEYRNSESAFAFDELSKGLRAWSTDGDMLEQLVPHTELADERRPGFLHVRLHGETLETAMDLAFPDLPGEWTDTLVNKGVYDRLAFLENADAIWIFVDGQKLADFNFGHGISARTCNLIGRLAKTLSGRVPLKLVVTRADQYGSLPVQMIDPIAEEAIDKGFELSIHEIISVDKATRERSGEGIPELLNATLTVVPLGASSEPSLLNSPRHMLRYRSEPIT